MTAAQQSATIDTKRVALNQDSPELQERLLDWKLKFCAPETTWDAAGERVDYTRFGMLSEIVKLTPIFVYDHPALKKKVPTAFVTTCGRMFFCDDFFKLLEAEQLAGRDSLFLLFAHEAEHLRRNHLERMRDLPPDLANKAQDIRINIDIVRVLQEVRLHLAGKAVTDAAIAQGCKEFLDGGLPNGVGDAVKKGCAMTYADHQKWGFRSSEDIGIELMKDWKEPPKLSELSGQKLAEGVAQDLDAIVADIKADPQHDPKKAKEVADLAVLLRAIGAAKGKAPTQKLKDAKDGLDQVLAGPEMLKRDLSGATVKTGDAVIDNLAPRMRGDLMSQLLELTMNPSAGVPADQGGVSITDWDLPGSSDPNAKPNGLPQPQQNNQPGHGSPANEQHMITAEEFSKILQELGLDKVAEKMGYKDLDVGDPIADLENKAKDVVVKGITEAAENLRRMPSLPGGHLTNYAVEKMNDFYEPVLRWRMAMKEILEGPGQRSVHDPMEAWAPYYSSPSDLGVDSQDDIGWVGSNVPRGSDEKHVVLVVIDSSGSVDTNMGKRFLSEALGMASEVSVCDSAPEVKLMMADTICRGDPVEIDQYNAKDFLSTGIGFRGRGGTNLTAGLQQALAMFEEGGRYEGQILDGVVYFTDYGDSPVDRNVLPERIPPVLFLGPVQCTNTHFEKGVADWATCITFNEKDLKEIDFEEADQKTALRNKVAA